MNESTNNELPTREKKAPSTMNLSVETDVDKIQNTQELLGKLVASEALEPRQIDDQEV